MEILDFFVGNDWANYLANYYPFGIWARKYGTNRQFMDHSCGLFYSSSCCLYPSICWGSKPVTHIFRDETLGSLKNIRHSQFQFSLSPFSSIFSINRTNLWVSLIFRQTHVEILLVVFPWNIPQKYPGNSIKSSWDNH